MMGLAMENLNVCCGVDASRSALHMHKAAGTIFSSAYAIRDAAACKANERCLIVCLRAKAPSFTD